MLAKVKSGALRGVDGFLVEVEVDIAFGMPAFTTVGLPEIAVKESKDRVKAAIKNSGYHFPGTRVTINLAPADVRKEGTGFDLPIALGLLAAQGLAPQETLDRYLLYGEVSLDGRLKATRGVLPVALACRRRRQRAHYPQRKCPGSRGGAGDRRLSRRASAGSRGIFAGGALAALTPEPPALVACAPGVDVDFAETSGARNR